VPTIQNDIASTWAGAYAPLPTYAIRHQAVRLTSSLRIARIPCVCCLPAHWRVRVRGSRRRRRACRDGRHMAGDAADDDALMQPWHRGGGGASARTGWRSGECGLHDACLRKGISIDNRGGGAEFPAARERCAAERRVSPKFAVVARNICGSRVFAHGRECDRNGHFNRGTHFR